MTDLAPPTDGRLRPTILAFGLAYLLASALVTIVLVIFNLDAPGGVAIGVLVGSTAIAARSFVVGNRRAMIRAEQLRFALLGVGVVLLLSLLQIAVLVPLMIPKAEMPAVLADVKALLAEHAPVVGLVTVTVVLIYIAVMYFTAGWFSRRFNKRLAASGKI